jgi:hypothetical protein
VRASASTSDRRRWPSPSISLQKRMERMIGVTKVLEKANSQSYEPSRMVSVAHLVSEKLALESLCTGVLRSCGSGSLRGLPFGHSRIRSKIPAIFFGLDERCWASAVNDWRRYSTRSVHIRQSATANPSPVASTASSRAFGDCVQQGVSK